MKKLGKKNSEGKSNGLLKARRGLVELDFFLAALLLIALATLYLNFSEENFRAAGESKKVATLELNALKASEMLKRKCGWNFDACKELLGKLNATAELGGKTVAADKNISNRVCVLRLYGKQGREEIAEVCAS